MMPSASCNTWFKLNIDPHSQCRTDNHINAKFALGLWNNHILRSSKPLLYKHKYWCLLNCDQSLGIVQEETNKAQGNISSTYLKASSETAFINVKNINHRNINVVKYSYLGSNDQKLSSGFIAEIWVCALKIFSNPEDETGAFGALPCKWMLPHT